MTALTLEKRSGAKGNFVPMRLAMLELLNDVPCDLYIDNGQSSPTLWRASGIAISRDDFDKLRERGINSAYVRSADFPRVQEAISEGLESVLENSDVSKQERFGFLQTAVSVEINQAFQMINVNSAVERAVDIGQKIVGLLKGGDALPLDLFGVVKHDYYTFTHITNVAAYAVLLAEQFGITDPDELNQIAIGGLLHDIGKRMISPAILNKTGKPSEREWKIIEEHPQTGYMELCDREDLNHRQLMMVYQHHEKLDGTGYPVHAAGDDIHPWAQLCAVVDIFDAMTCKRPYRKAMDISDVLAHIGKMSGHKLNQDMVECWTSAMKKNN